MQTPAVAQRRSLVVTLSALFLGLSGSYACGSDSSNQPKPGPGDAGDAGATDAGDAGDAGSDALASDATTDAGPCPSGWTGSDCKTACKLTWSAPPSAPMTGFAYDSTYPGRSINDPSVIKDASGYRMWYTVGDPAVADTPISVHLATSPDGLNWTHGTTSLLDPGASGSWDDRAIETASVTRGGDGTYHLYYSGAAMTDSPGVFYIGHATSPDGIAWTKDPANPVLSPVVPPENSDWGIFTAAEPGVVYDPRDKLYRLYYAAAGGSADHDGNFAILLATSTDGTNFTQHRDGSGNREPVWSLTSSYPPSVNPRGYSTPEITIGPDGYFHLTHDVVFDPNGFDQFALAYARSSDGINFEEVSANIVANTDLPWLSGYVLAPSMIFDGDKLALWFTGGEVLVSFNTWTFGTARVDGSFDCNN